MNKLGNYLFSFVTVSIKILSSAVEMFGLVEQSNIFFNVKIYMSVVPSIMAMTKYFHYVTKQERPWSSGY